MVDAQKIREEFAKIVPDYQDVLQFQADGELIVNDIEKKIGSSKKALILGSYWEHQLAKKTDTFFVSLSMPVLNEIITNGSYAGYSGGLTPFQAIRRIVLPQALNYALPNLSTIIIGLLKDGSLAFTIGLIDVFGPLFNGFFFYPKLRTLLYTIKMSEYKIVENQLNAEDFKALFKDAGWGNPCEKMIEVSLKKSYATFSVLDGDKVIGCARLLGDGAMAFFVKDVIIKSEFRGKGIGKMLMTYVEDFIKRQIEPGWWTCVELMSAGGKESFYEKLGFERRPTETRGAGMMKMVGREEK